MQILLHLFVRQLVHYISDVYYRGTLASGLVERIWELHRIWYLMLWDDEQSEMISIKEYVIGVPRLYFKKIKNYEKYFLNSF